ASGDRPASRPIGLSAINPSSTPSPLSRLASPVVYIIPHEPSPRRRPNHDLCSTVLGSRRPTRRLRIECWPFPPSRLDENDTQTDTIDQIDDDGDTDPA